MEHTRLKYYFTFNDNHNKHEIEILFHIQWQPRRHWNIMFIFMNTLTHEIETYVHIHDSHGTHEIETYVRLQWQPWHIQLWNNLSSSMPGVVPTRANQRWITFDACYDICGLEITSYQLRCNVTLHRTWCDLYLRCVPTGTLVLQSVACRIVFLVLAERTITA